MLSLEVQNIRRIETPELFYKTITELIRKSKNVYLSSMYLGAEERLIEMLKILSERVRDNRRTIILLDGNRGVDDYIKRLLEKYKIKKIVVYKDVGVLGNIIRQCYSYSSYCTLKELKYLNLYEFRKEGYTMHNKGIWVFNNSKVTTIIGPSNFNRRSIERDIEGNFIISTEDKDHISLFKDLIDFLISNSKLIERNDMLKRKFSLLIILFFFILNKFF